MWKAGAQFEWLRALIELVTGKEHGVWLDSLYMVDKDVSYAKAGDKQTFYIDFDISCNGDYDGPVAFMRRGMPKEECFFSFRLVICLAID